MNSGHPNTTEAGSAPARAGAEAAELAALVEWITEATAPIVGEDFFRQLVELLATRMRVDTALITQCPEAERNRAETLALWHHGDFMDNFAFDLAGTPCEHVIHDGRFCFLPDGVSQRFPDWAQEEGGVESFIGVPVRCPRTGDVLGHIAIYDGRPMQRGAVADSMFRIIAARAGAEIRRRQEETARRRSEALARQRLEELARVSRRASMGELASALAHELRQPLTSMTTYLQGALRRMEGGDADPALRDALERALSGAERTGGIVRRLRAWVDTSKPRCEPVDVAVLLRDTARLMAAEADGLDARIEIDRRKGIQRIDGDFVLLQQVLVNLIRNALQALERAGAATRTVRLRAGAGSGGVFIEVADAGDGVGDERAARLFEPFSSGRDEGLGVGLWLCRSLVESHGGTLELASQRDPTVFRITLPVQAAADSGGAPSG